MVEKKLFFLTICYLIFVSGRSDPVGYLLAKDSGLEEKITPAIKLEKFGSSLYYIGFIFTGTWYQAMQFCKYHHMDLVSIETKEENEFLFDQMKSFFGGSSDYWFWTAGTTLSNGHWVWMNTGRPIIYSNWFTNQPDNAGGNEPCIEVRYNYKEGLKWNDNNCNAAAKLHVICEATVSKNVSQVLSNMCSATNAVTIV